MAKRKSILTPQETTLIRTQTREGRQLSLPGWDDVIHITPDKMLTAHDLAAKKYARALRMASTGKEQTTRSVTWMLTQIDNVQDALVTSAVALRGISLAIPRLKPIALLAGRGADALNLGTMAKTLGKAGSKGKRGLEARFAQSPGYYQGRVKNVTNLRSALPHVAEVLQLLQTSDQLTGVGLSLGAIMALPSDLISDMAKDLTRTRPLPSRAPLSAKEADALEAEWALNWTQFRPSAAPLQRGAMATAVGIAQPSSVVIPLVTEIVGRLFPARPQTAAEQLADMARMFEATSWMSTMPDAFLPEDHLAAAVAQHVALVRLQALGSSISFARLAEPFLDTIITPGAPTDPVTRWALREAGLDPNDPGALPLHASPTRASMRDIQAELQEVIPSVLPQWRESLETDEEEEFAGALCAYAAGAPWKILEGEDPQFRQSYSGPARALITLADYGLQIPQEFPDEHVEQLVTDLSSVWYKHGGCQPFPDEAQQDLHDALSLLQP
jgi:hypothetical protein